MKNFYTYLFKLILLATTVLMTADFVQAQSQEIQGTVIDANSGETLPGVNVVVQGTSTGTSTNAQGEFSLEVPEDSDVLVFSFVGFQTAEIELDGRTQLHVELEPDVQGLDDVVVVGYGVQEKSDLTGSVSSVRGDALTATSGSNPIQALQGEASGVQVLSSGEPGSSPEVRIRGIGTTNNASPLYVVDGLMVEDLSFLNKNDIESIEVLKDASATAIYGSRGANGVILVTTKKGTSSTPQFTFSVSEGIEQPRSFEMTNAREYATLINEGMENTGQSPTYNLDEIQNSTDWFDEVLSPASVRDYNLTFSQGTENNSYYVGVGMHQQNGVVDKSGYERYSIRINNEYSLSDHITIGHNLAGSWAENANRHSEAFGWTYRIPPTIPVYNADGSYADTGILSSGNIIAALDYHNNTTDSRSLVGNFFADINFWDHFQFRSSLGIDLQNEQSMDYTPEYFVSSSQKNELSSLSKSWINNSNWLWENTLNYSNSFGRHKVDAVAGFTAQENNYEILEGNRNNIFSNNPNLWYLDAGETEGAGNANIAHSSGIVSYLGRVNYTLMDRYLFTATIRADGSSRFAEDHRWGTFPSFAAGWRVSEETFLNNVDWLSELKLRGSWGRIGNQNIGNYRYFATAATGIGYAGIWNNTIDPGATVTTLANRNITWESSEQMNAGLEFSILEDKITGGVDWYKKTTQDMLVIVGVPASVGMGATEGNVGSVENKGVEFNLNLNGTQGDWFYSIGLNGATINNKVIDLGTEEELIGGDIGAGRSITRARIGEPIGFFYGYKSLGPFDTQEEIDNAPAQDNVQPGDLRMADINGDGVINADDRTNIGSGIPDYTGALNLSVGYKAFELAVDFYGSFGNEIYDGKNQTRYSGEDNFSREWLNRWNGPGTSERVPRITFGGDWNYETSSRWVYDGSFIKLQNVRLQYTLPSSILENLPISMARVHISGNNLHYFTDYHGMSPEISNSGLNRGIDNNIYPVSAFYQIGATVNF